MFERFLDLIRANESIFKLILFIVFMILIVVFMVLGNLKERKDSKSKGNIKKFITISMLSAFSIALYFFPKIPLPFLPSFLKIHFSSIPIYIGGFLFGPFSGGVIAIVRMILKIFLGSSSFYIGELADVFIGLCTVMISSFIYHKYRTKRAAFISILTIIFVWVGVALFVNWLFVMPLYVNLMGLEGLVGSLSKVIPNINEDNYMGYYLLYGALPFNLIMATLMTSITFLTYKQISRLYGRIGDDGKEEIDVFNN